MAQLGRAILLLGLGVCLYGIGASIHGAREQRPDWVASGRRAMYALAALSVFAFVLLEIAFLRNDFSFKVVANTSATTIPVFYKLTAPWSSQQGSLLLWVTLSSLWASVALFLTRRRLREIAPYAAAVLLGMQGFFAALACFAANPFATTPAALTPSNGAGLDPLLMHPSMMFHPPMLYSGYTLMAIPFAFAIGALITGKLGSDWIRGTRRFALAAWLCLGVGIVLGARWSYTELGWGGYWGWDAVEDAALMPWLICTAFIHSIQIQEKRGMLKVWNVSLVLAFGTLAIFGTFLVRSGVLDSIHAFGASTLGVPFVVLLGVMFFSSVGLVVWRRDLLSTDHRLDSLLSREAMFLLQNLVLVAMTFVIFWITLFPLISEAITGTSISVGPPAFTPFVVPLALLLVLLTGIGPLISWRRATIANLRKQFIFPVGFGSVRDDPGAGTDERGQQAAGGPDVLLRRVRDRHRFAGVLSRHGRATGDHGRRLAGRDAGSGATQPPALRRLYRARRLCGDADRGRGVVVLPALASSHPQARAERLLRRLCLPLRAPDSLRHRRTGFVRRDHRRHQARQTDHASAHDAELLSVDEQLSGPDQSLLR